MEVPRDSILIRDYGIDYKERYASVLKPHVSDSTLVVFTLDAEALAQQLLELSPKGATVRDIPDDVLPLKEVSLTGGNVVLINIQDAYGTQAGKVAEVLTQRCGARNILFAGVCGGIGQETALHDVILFSSISRPGGQGGISATNSVSASELSGYVSPTRIRERLVITAPTLFGRESW
jgi:hypothetical protein